MEELKQKRLSKYLDKKQVPNAERKQPLSARQALEQVEFPPSSYSPLATPKATSVPAPGALPLNSSGPVFCSSLSDAAGPADISEAFAIWSCLTETLLCGLWLSGTVISKHIHYFLGLGFVVSPVL